MSARDVVQSVGGISRRNEVWRFCLHIRVGFDIRFLVPAPTAAILLLHVYPERYHFVQPERLTIVPPTPGDAFHDIFGNACTRLMAPPGMLCLSSDAIVDVDGELDPADL